ncbi:MAG: tRNA uridine(34) 5-carboxymethylaminomethyl modification radical SAM/GNAT enzyme Elp3 [Anaerolineaceae bacterium]|nr:tRNA uridine(34) 5-carboxymethylaminomethyl modification radical SAM/GNAT enzyme Elp3 [Anaerolineaceae bacterium]
MIEKISQETQWRKRREITPEKEEIARIVLEEVRNGLDVLLAIRRHPLPSGGHISKGILVAIYWEGVREGEWDADLTFLRKIRKKPMRSLSGVTTVTVLTRPQACPGKCIFCPDDVRMPKSYLPDEPAAARALQSQFDPFVQVENRLRALQNVGHPTDKIEVLILGSSWDAYPIDYREWFVKRCFDALNDVDSESLDEAHHKNETAQHRNVGLTIETRPDMITPTSILHMRKLGVTRVQLGVQSLDDSILELNHRGHNINRALEAVAMLRAAGFKIVLHWMPNLLGATPESDIEDFARLWQPASEGLGFCPDELKIYPTQLLENTVLYDRWKAGEYHPYTTEQLINLIAEIKPTIPHYCRLNRVIRDIPSNHVVEGNKRTSLRQDVVQELKTRGQHCSCIRCREVRDDKLNPDELKMIAEIYYPASAEEHFLEFVTEDDKLAGFLRLSFPNPDQDLTWRDKFFPDLKDAAIIREIHVYGQSLKVGGEQNGAAQHIGLGTALIEEAVKLSKIRGYQRLAVISAIGTHRYYAKRNFKKGESYMIRDI